MTDQQRHWGREVELDKVRFAEFWQRAIKHKEIDSVRCTKTLERLLKRKIDEVPGYSPIRSPKLTSDTKYKISSGQKNLLGYDVCYAIFEISRVDVTRQKLFSVSAPKLVAFECVTRIGNREQFKVVLKELTVLNDQMPFRNEAGDFIGRIHVGLRQGQLCLVADGLGAHDDSFKDEPTLCHTDQNCNFNLTLFGKKELSWKLQPKSQNEKLNGNLLNVVIADLVGFPSNDDCAQIRAKIFDLDPEFEEIDGQDQYSPSQRNMLDFVVKALIKRSDEEVTLATCDLSEERYAHKS